MVVAFFVTTIFSVIIYKYVPVYVTPLMVIRTVSSSESIHHKWISLEEMPKDIVKAVIASEDAHFLSHNGFDFKAIKQAIEHNKKNNKTKRGASTISQQTAKNVFLWPSRSWLRKGLEAYFTVLIELFWDKQRIIEVYLNSIEMGNGIFGIAAVADKHFDKEPEKLTKRQCALIAATLPNPIKFNSAAPSPYMRKRQRVILREMNSVKIEDEWFQ
jgi:monofunctional biosynthetic peptidoglycan transglycosylase